MIFHAGLCVLKDQEDSKSKRKQRQPNGKIDIHITGFLASGALRPIEVSSQVFPRRCNVQLAMLNSPQAEDAIRQALNLVTAAFQNNHLEAVVVV